MQNPTPTASIDPRALAAFHSEMASRQIDMTLYDLSFFETPDSFLVVAGYKLRDPRMRGSDPRHPNYEVLISRADFSITRVSVAR